MRESELQRRCVEWARKAYGKGLVVVNLHGGGWCNKGFPDLLALGRGHAVAIELKAPGGGYALQADQQVWRDRLLTAGVPHYVIDCVEDFKKTIEDEFYEAER